MRYSSWITAGPSKPNALLAMVLKSSRRQSTPTERCVRWKLPAAPSGSGSVVGKLTTVKSGSSGRSLASSSSAAAGAGGGGGVWACALDELAPKRINPRAKTNAADVCRITVGPLEQGKAQP